MQHFSVSDQVYRNAQRLAAEAGFPSVDNWVERIIEIETSNDVDDLDRFFTPDRLAEIDETVAEVKAGNSLSADQVRDHFQQ